MIVSSNFCESMDSFYENVHIDKLKNREQKVPLMAQKAERRKKEKEVKSISKRQGIFFDQGSS